LPLFTRETISMHSIDRRAALAALALIPLGASARAGTPEQLKFAADDGDVVVTRYGAPGPGKRPGVVLLHGTHGFERRLAAYERYTSTLTAKGIDSYLLRYLTTADTAFFDSGAATRTREAFETRRYDGWAKRVSAGVTAILKRPDSSSQIGLLGFSLGGFVAAATAARDPRIDALAVLYAGMPAAMMSEVKHLPPLIELHGEADTNVAFAEGEHLVKLGRKLGAEAEQVPYPGKAHGFDLSETDPMAADAIARVVRFFDARLRGA
jgi:carboxymethylenebutenolidase